MDVFEHRYDPQTRWWYGVADLAATLWDFNEMLLQSGTQGVYLVCRLDDGREGDAAVTTGCAGAGFRGDFCLVKVFGVTGLARPGEERESIMPPD